MRVVGCAVEIRNGARPALAVTVVDDASGSPIMTDAFELTSSDEDLATQLATLHASAQTRVRALGHLDRAVVRRADKPPRPVNTDGPRLRLLAEGAVIAAVRGIVPDTRVGAGVDLGRWHGAGKAGVDGAGAAAVANAGGARGITDAARLSQAAAAALAGLVLKP